MTLAGDARELVQALPRTSSSRTACWSWGPEGRGRPSWAWGSAEQITYLLDLTGWVERALSPRPAIELWLPLFDGGRADQLGLLAGVNGSDMEVLSLLVRPLVQGGQIRGQPRTSRSRPTDPARLHP